MHPWMIYFDLHMGISRWRERWTKQGRYKGVWDATLQRESLVLRDGRTLTYFLDGPPQVLPSRNKTDTPHIFCFHAMFLSGNSFLMSEAPKEYVLVCVNRPGYFGSDLPDDAATAYDYHKFAQDVEQLADHLGLKTFYVVGHSSGGPCSLACAACLPNRVTAVGILSGDPEYAHEGVPNKRRSSAFLLGSLLPCLLKYVLCFLPMARNGVKGLENDFRLETSIYSFRTEGILHPTIVFVGESDKVMPLEVSRHVHRRLQNGTMKTIPKVGHLGLLRDKVLQEMFAMLLSLGSSSAELTSEQVPLLPGQEAPLVLEMT